jgi:hypothetical protein
MSDLSDELEATETACIIDGCWGIYVPREFASRGMAEAWGVKAEDIEILLAGPDHEFYWETWDDVEREAAYVDASGKRWTLYQDGDLFAVYYAPEVVHSLVVSNPDSD